MPLSKPYKRNARIFIDNKFTEGGRAEYIKHKKYSQSPEQYIRGFLLIQKDLQNLFDYIEPADKNRDTYSYRIHELLLRTCVEVEANFVAIIKENIYTKKGNLTMRDYQKVNKTHRLSSYEIKIPIWNGSYNIRKPFGSWDEKDYLRWYCAYNDTKHDRHSKFENATFESLIDAVCGLLALITSQFLDNEFPSSDILLSLGSGTNDGMESSIGDFFRIKYPTDWEEKEKYDFRWQEIKNDPNPFNLINYDKIN